jgi:mRNA interferase RelE/StbE
MASYKVWTVTFKQSVAKDLRAIPNIDVRRILDRIETLATNPRGEGCVKLAGQDRYRVRHGVYRIVYEIHDDRLVVIVVKVGHRSSVYEMR